MSVAARSKAGASHVSPLVIAVIFASLVLVVLAAAAPNFVPVFPFAMLYTIVLCLMWRRLSPVAMSPAVYFSGYLAVVAVLGVLLSNALVGSGGTGGVDVAIDQSLAANTANLMLSGGVIVLLSAAAIRGRNRTADGIERVLDLGDLSRYAGWFLVFGTLELVALVLFQGTDLFERAYRLVGRGSTIETVISMAAIAAVVVVGIAFFMLKGGRRVYAFFLLAGFVGYFVGMGTRRLALVPLLLLLAFAVSRRGRVSGTALGIAAAAGILTLALPLHFRGQSSHGIGPYIASLSTFQISPEVMATSFNNFLAGFKITALTSQAPKIPIDILWISINPISGDSAGWYQVAPSLRLNRFTPYSALGELLNYGLVVALIAMVCIGLALGLVQRFNDRLLPDKIGRFISIISLGLIAIFVIQSAQYNLRADIRYLYLALGIQVVGSIAIAARNALAARRGEPRLRRR